jgi:hypothetical protein
MTFNPTEAKDAAHAAIMDRDHDLYTSIKFSDAMLKADIEKGDLGHMSHPRQAAELLRLPDTASRKRAYDEASTMQNFVGGTMSGCLYRAVSDVLHNIAAGDPEKELYYAAAARRHREAENAMREATGQRVILYPPELRKA